MRRFWVLIFIWQIILAGMRFVPESIALAAPQKTGVQGGPAVLCLPGIYLYDPMDCVPAGPAGFLSQMAERGITFPLAPMSFSRMDASLGEVNVRYGEVRTANAPIYGSIDDALKNNRKAAIDHLNGEFVFISYTDEQLVGNKRIYQVDPGRWMTASDISRIGVLPKSLGLIFNRTPTTAFGWVLNYFGPNPLYTKRTPGSQSGDFTTHELKLFEIVPIFATQKVGEEEWYMVGADEWAPRRVVARVTPNTTPPKGVTGDRWIEVNLEDQTLAVYDKHQLVFATVVASGAEPFWTQPGLFQIYEKHESTPMRGALEGGGGDAYYLEDVPWTMYYDKARALHGAYWRAKMGFPQSHGCINLTVGDAHWLYNWAKVGDPVYVWDPSGKTPTDPSLYSSGGF